MFATLNARGLGTLGRWFLILLVGLAAQVWGIAQSVTFNGAAFVMPGITASLPYGMTVDGQGNLYIANSAYGDSYIVQVTPWGQATNLHSYDLAIPLQQPGGLAMDANGALYIADTGNNRVVKVVNGHATVVTAIPANPWSHVAVDGQGTLYLTDYEDNLIATLSGTTYNTLTESGLYLPLNEPMDLVVDPTSGHLFVADFGNGRVLEMSLSGTTLSLVQAFATGPSSSSMNPFALAQDGHGNLLIADAPNNRIITMVKTSGAASGVSTGPLGLDYPQGIALDASGNLFIADTIHTRLIEVGLTAVNLGQVTVGSTATLTLPFTVTGSPALGTGSPQVLTQGQPTQAFTAVASGTTLVAGTSSPASATVEVQFQPSGPGLFTGAVAIYDTNANLLASVPVYGTGEGSLPVFTPSAKATVIPSSGLNLMGDCPAAMDGAGNMFFVSTGHQVMKLPAMGGTAFQVISGLQFPKCLALDGLGNLYIGDGYNLELLTPQGTFSTLNVTGLPAGTTFQPRAMTTDSLGNLYVVALIGNRNLQLYGGTCWVFKLDPQGVASVLPLGDITFGSNVNGLAIDPAGTLYVSIYDPANTPQIVKIPAGGTASLLTVATQNGVSLTFPTGVAVDRVGNLYIADYALGVFCVPANGPVTLLQNPGLQTSGSGNPSGLLVDGAGNVIVLQVDLNQLVQIPTATPPALTFADTVLGSTSSDSPQTVTITNLGNQNLGFGDASIYTSSSFPPNQTDATLVGTGPATIVPGSSGDVSVSFTPQAAGSLTTSLELATGQTITCSGVGLVPTTTQVTTPSTTPVAFAPTSLTATVTGTPGTPTGSVTFLDDATPLGTANLVSGVATLSTSALTGGNHTITAQYGASGGFGASTGSLSLTVTPATPTALLTATPNPEPVFGTITLTATLTGLGVSPTGTVTFQAGGQALGTPVALNAGTATAPVIFQAPGPQSLTVSYSGDSNYTGLTSAALTETIAQATATISVGSSASTAPTLSPVTFTATVTGPEPNPSGTATFLVDGAALGTVSVTSGTATLTTSALTPGTHAITVTYSGDTDLAGITSPALTQVISLATPTVTLSTSAATATGLTQVTLTATVSGNGGVPTGTVTFLDATTTLGTAQLSGGVATFTTSSLPVGSQSITASYASDGTFAAASSQALGESITSNPATVALNASASPVAALAPVTFTALVTSAQGTPTGLVNFMDGTTVLAANVALSNGSATFTTSGLTAGTHTLTATYQGGPDWSTATSAPLSQTITPLATTLTLTTTATTAAGGPGNLVATVSSPAGTPTGSVLFTAGSTSVTVPLTNGAASYALTNLPADTEAITATYTGDADDSTSLASYTVTVTQPVLVIPAPPVPAAIPAGNPVSVPFTLGSLGTVSGPVTLAASNLPQGVTCTFSPNPVTLTAGQQNPITATLTTTAQPAVTASLGRGLTPASGGIGAGLLACGLLALPAARNRKRLRLGFLGLGVLLLAVLAACQGSSHGAASQAALPTPAGSYTITVTAASQGSVEATTTIQLTVTNPS